MTLLPFPRLAIFLAGALIGPSAIAEPPSSERAFLAANDKAMTTMMADMAVAPSGDVDRDFLRMMIPHHRGAIDMCRPLLKYGKRADLRALCRRIIADQSREIVLMRSMLGPERTVSARAPMAGMDMGRHPR